MRNINHFKAKGIKIISNKEDLFELVKDKAGEIVAFDGISGTGKNYLIEFLLKKFGIDEDIAEKQDGKFGLDTDVFLGSNTENFEESISFAERRKRISNLIRNQQTPDEIVAELKKVFRNEKHLSRVLNDILYALDNNLVSFTKKGLFLYNRGKGVVEKGRVSVEVKEQLPYLTGGTNVAEVAKKTSRKINTILLYSDPHISILNALYRDFMKNKLDGVNRFNFRLQETFALEIIQKQNIEAGYIDYLFKDDSVFPEIMNKYKEQDKFCETGHCLDDFMKKMKEIFAETENTEFYSGIENKEFMKFKDNFWGKFKIIAKKYFARENLLGFLDSVNE